MKKSIFTILFFLTLFLGGNITNAQKVVVINKHNRHKVIKVKPNKPKLIIIKPNKVRRNHVWVKGALEKKKEKSYLGRRSLEKVNS